VLSYCGSITVTFTSDRSLMPDPERYANCLQESFEEMKAAALKRPIPAPRPQPAAEAKPAAEEAKPANKARPRKRKPKLTIVSAAE
jgi:hypothetical protein